jgi:phosphoribosylanthranilate isomerase
MKNNPKLKICGITQAGNMLEIAALKPDYMGFIFYPPSPRDVSEKIKNLPLNLLAKDIKKVAVMVNSSLENAMEIVAIYGFDMVQLHGQESPSYCNDLRKKVKVVKAFSVKDDLPENLEEYENSCDYFLFDTKADKPGGTGLRFNHDILKQYKGRKPFFLSGGIDPEYGKNNDSFFHPWLYALDINSRFETTPGIKDVEMVKKFMEKRNSF